MSMTVSNVLTVQSVDRALLILERLKDYPNGLGVTDLSKDLGVSKSTIHRLLMSLSAKGYVKQDLSTDNYALGLKFIEFGEIVSNYLDVRKIAAPFLQELALKTGETVHLVVRENYEVVYIDKIESPATIRMFSRIGKRALMHCTGVGKAILAHLPDKIVNDILEQRPTIKFTENTITRKEKLLIELETIRKNGYSFDNEEHEEGVKCVAAPLIDHNGQVVAAISVAAPAMRMETDNLRMSIRTVVEQSVKISKSLGYFP